MADQSNPTYVKLYQLIGAKLVESFPEFKVGQEQWPYWLAQSILDAIWSEIETLAAGALEMRDLLVRIVPDVQRWVESLDYEDDAKAWLAEAKKKL